MTKIIIPTCPTCGKTHLMLALHNMHDFPGTYCCSSTCALILSIGKNATKKAFDEHKKHRKEQQRQADMKAEREEQQWLRRIPL